MLLGAPRSCFRRLTEVKIPVRNPEFPFFFKFSFPFFNLGHEKFPFKTENTTISSDQGVFPKTAALSFRAARTHPLTNTPHCSWWACCHFRVSHSSHISGYKRSWRCFRSQERASLTLCQASVRPQMGRWV